MTSGQVRQVADEGTAVRALDIAERLVQTRGFNDVSYADVAGELGITKPSLHYHFASKAALGDALIARYASRFYAALEQIAAEEPDPRARLARYADLYRRVLAAGRMCLCGILAAEYQTLPDGMRAAVLEFFDRNEAWLVDVLRDGVSSGVLKAEEPLADVARMIIDTLEGAVMVSRVRGDIGRFDQVASRLLASLAV